ncbi:hypothetical protein JNJ66_07385 [Candidatus Saccharibacteria bacterium]|nr:hypothetical protein [Candidatus Saccharibacteria bacterium]
MDVTTLPLTRVYTCKDGSTIDMVELVKRARPVIEAMMEAGFLKQTDAMGFVMLEPAVVGHDNRSKIDPDDPSTYVWFAGGWGDEKRLHALIANAVRKLRGMLREQVDSTLEMRLDPANFTFENLVPSVDENDEFPWGDFGWAGALRLFFDDLELGGAISVFSELGDHTVTALLLHLFYEPMAAGDGLLPENTAMIRLKEAVEAKRAAAADAATPAAGIEKIDAGSAAYAEYGGDGAER